MIDIQPDQLDIVHKILAKHVPNLEVWAFGSRVTGKARKYSDLDLAFITQEPMSLGLYGDLKEDFSESDLPFRVDILDWASTSDSFRRIVERDKVVIQAPPQDLP